MIGRMSCSVHVEVYLSHALHRRTAPSIAQYPTALFSHWDFPLPRVVMFGICSDIGQQHDWSHELQSTCRVLLASCFSQKNSPQHSTVPNSLAFPKRKGGARKKRMEAICPTSVFLISRQTTVFGEEKVADPKN